MSKKEKSPIEFLGELKNTQNQVLNKTGEIEKLCHVYFIYGEESYVSERASQRMKKIVSSLGGSFERVIFGNISISDWLTEMYNIPMFASKRLIIASNVADLKADDIEQLINYAKYPSPDVYLLLLSASLDKRKKNMSKLIEHTCSCNAKHPSNNDVDLWIRGFAAEKGKKIEPLAIEFLKTRFGNNLAILEKELEKISLYISDKITIEKKDAEYLILGNSSSSIFDFYPLLARRDKKAILVLLHKLLDAGENHLSLLSIISKRIKQLLLGSDLVNNGSLNDSLLIEKTGVHPYFIKNFKTELKQYERKELKLMYNTCIEIDSKLKSSKLDKDTILFSGILKLAEHK